MRNRILLVLSGVILLAGAYLAGVRKATVAHAQEPAAYPRQPMQGSVPKSYGRLVAAIPDRIGTGVIFEDEQGTIRFVSINGMKEGELARYDKTPTRGGIPRSYGHLVAAVVNGEGTGLVFEDSAGAIRFVTITGVVEGELTRE